MPTTKWPAIDHETHRWVHRDPMASRRARIRNTGNFKAAVVPDISSLTPDLSHDTLASAHNATASMVAFDRESGGLASLPFAAVLLRGESATSSQIENLTVRARKLSLAAVGAHIGGNAELVARNVEAMRAAIDTASHLDSDAILTMHRVLTEGVQGDAGECRNEWVWIGGDSPVTAAYVAPEYSHVPAAIEDLINFLHRRDLDPTVQAAIAHAQFETIHPFTDGNGRTGRAIVSSLLRARGTVQNVNIPISSGLLHDIDDYINALNDYRAGNPASIVDCFSNAVLGSLANANQLIDDVRAFHEQVLDSRRRVTSPLRAVAELCCSEPAFTAGMVENIAGISKATAYRTVDSLTEAGLLREERSIKVRGQKVWVVPAVVSALDDFAERAGRRHFGS
ncbi:Fic family protein [Kocuria atrinae]|uniref:Fic family protein n=1 Tax=Kocuria atrinae TaxID=592377 RepID=UPI00036531BC|nr:Fic family protein [Kocuria atrinae]